VNREQLIKNFDRCIDWEDKYLYIISLGEKHALLPTEEQTKQHAIYGCQSNVWIKVEQIDDQVVLTGSSDAALVKGLVALVILLLKDLTPQQILETDIKALFTRLGLQQQLTPARNQGLESMVQSIYKQVSAFSHA